MKSKKLFHPVALNAALIFIGLLPSGFHQKHVSWKEAFGVGN